MTLDAFTSPREWPQLLAAANAWSAELRAMRRGRTPGVETREGCAPSCHRLIRNAALTRSIAVAKVVAEELREDAIPTPLARIRAFSFPFNHLHDDALAALEASARHTRRPDSSRPTRTPDRNSRRLWRLAGDVRHAQNEFLEAAGFLSIGREPLDPPPPPHP